MVLDAVITLSYRHNNGRITTQSRERLERTENLYLEGFANKICLSGRAAYTMKKQLQVGVREKDVILEENSLDTVGNALFTKLELVVHRNYRSIGIVSSEYHIQRTREIFRVIYGKNFNLHFFKVKGDSEGASDEPQKLKKFRETFAGINPGDYIAIIERLFSSHEIYKNMEDKNQLKSRLMRSL